MKYLLLALLLIGAILSLAASPSKPPTGTLELTNTPTYGGEATFHVYLPKKAQLVNSVVWCRQQTDTGSMQDVWMEEMFLPNTGWSKGRYDGLVSYWPLQGQYWEPSLPAYCSAVVFEDIHNGNEAPHSLTNGVSFIVPAVVP